MAFHVLLYEHHYFTKHSSENVHVNIRILTQLRGYREQNKINLQFINVLYSAFPKPL